MRASSHLTINLKVLFGIAVVANLLPLLCSCSTIRGHQPQNPTTAWVRLSPPNGGFSVLLPSLPKEIITEEPRTKGTPVQVHNFFVNPNNTKEFGVIYSDFPDDIPFIDEKVIFDAGQQAALQKLGEGRLIFAEDCNFDLNPMRKIKFEVPEKQLSFDMRSILVGRRWYQLIFASQIGNDVSSEVDFFFNSFRLEESQ